MLRRLSLSLLTSAAVGFLPGCADLVGANFDRPGPPLDGGSSSGVGVDAAAPSSLRVYGGLRSMAAPAAQAEVRVVAGSFEGATRTCSAQGDVCVTGGIVP